MYNLWQKKFISMPSEYWNASVGDKMVLRAFYERDQEDRNKLRLELKNNKTPVFPTTVI